MTIFEASDTTESHDLGVAIRDSTVRTFARDSSGMNYILITQGSHGDVLPFVGLGSRLRQRGHRVTLVTNEHFQDQASANGFGFVPIGTEEDYQREFENPDIWKSLPGIMTLGRWIARSMPMQYQAIIERYEKGNTVVVASSAAFGARIAHETLGLPLVTLLLQPALVRSAYRMPVVAGLPPIPDWVPRIAMRSFFRLFDVVEDYVVRADEVNAFRATLGLPRIKRLVNTWWLSPQLVKTQFPEWFGMPQPHWPKALRTTGFPLCDGGTGDSALPDEVDSFLDQGTPPIVFTPGTGMMHGKAFFEAAVQACELLDRRGILLTRFTEHLPANLPPTVRHFSYVPFGQLLARAAAIVHHGGVGTLSQAMAAGIPQLIMPLAYDQPDNARRLKHLGVGDSLKPARFRGPAVARKLRHLLNSSAVTEDCQMLARKLSGADALHHTCELIEELTS